jgi:hypothetical protein
LVERVHVRSAAQRPQPFFPGTVQINYAKV